MNVQLTDEENLRITQNTISVFIESLRVKVFDENTMVLLKLFEEVLREIKRFSEDRNDLTITSLKVRNIFELYLITKHVNANSKGLHNWCGQGYMVSRK